MLILKIMRVEFNPTMKNWNSIMHDIIILLLLLLLLLFNEFSCFKLKDQLPQILIL